MATKTYVFRLEGLDSAPLVADIERSLEELGDIRATIIYPRRIAWVSAGEDVTIGSVEKQFARHGVTATLTEASARRAQSAVTRRARRNVPSRRRRKRQREQRALARARAAGYMRRRHVLFTARELVSPARLVVAVLLTIPVAVLDANASLLRSWIALILALPVVTWCAWPFIRALVGGVRRGVAALDGASTIAILAAWSWSAGCLVMGDASATYITVACAMTVVLLFGRLITYRNAPNLEERLANAHAHALENRIVTVDGQKELPLGEVNVGDDIAVHAGETIPVDGNIVGGSSFISPGTISMTGNNTVKVSVGSHVFAGTVNGSGRLKVRVERTGHRTRMAAVIRWLTEACHRQDKATMVSTRSAALLIPATVTIAALSFLGWYVITRDAAGAAGTVLAVLAAVGPVTLAYAPGLASRYGLEGAACAGILLRDGSTLRSLDNIDTLIFNRQGTLTTGEMIIANIAVVDGVHPELVLRVAAALAMETEHPTMKAIVKAARESRDRDDIDSENPEIPHWIEASRVTVAESGDIAGQVELPSGTVPAGLWRPRTMSAVPRELRLAVSAGGTPVIVRIDGRDVGVIALQDFARDDADTAIERLADHGIETVMISRDAYPVARRFADRLGIDHVLAGIPAGGKTGAVRSLHTQGASTAFVGDNTVMRPMSAADLGILIGPERGQGSADLVDTTQRGVDVIVLTGRVADISALFAHARRVRRTIDVNLIFGWAYNIVAMVLAVAGVLHPMAAMFAMIASTWIVEWRSKRMRVMK